MAIGVNWGDVWKPVWSEVWAQTQESPAVETNTGGWETYRHYDRRRKTDEDVRLERIRLGILPPDEPKTVTLPSKTVVPVSDLTPPEINRIRQRVKNEIDQEIAFRLLAIEKRRRQMIALVLILDAA